MGAVTFDKLFPRAVGVASDALVGGVSGAFEIEPFLLPPLRTLLARLMNLDKPGLSSPSPEGPGAEELMAARNM